MSLSPIETAISNSEKIVWRTGILYKAAKYRLQDGSMNEVNDYRTQGIKEGENDIPRRPSKRTV